MGETTTIRERPILFSGPMVRAILAGRKTQTRRVMKPQPSDDYAAADFTVERYCPAIEDDDEMLTDGPEIFGAYTETEGWKCPYGGPGDRLWVRETWRLDDPAKLKLKEYEGGGNPDWIYYRADAVHEAAGYIDWRPSIHMPRWASRLTLEITGVKVERLQDITEEDAIAEGIEREELFINGHSEGMRYFDYAARSQDVCEWLDDPRKSFRTLWDSINGRREGCDWASNPWVWRIEFKPVAQPRDAAGRGGEQHGR